MTDCGFSHEFAYPQTLTIHASAFMNSFDLQPLDRKSLLNQIHATIPLPTREENCADGSLVFVGGDHGEVVVRVMADQITVSVFATEIETSGSLGVRPQQIVTLNWKIIPAAKMTLLLRDLIETAQQLRRAQFRKCRRCNETKPPEWMYDAELCEGCVDSEVASGR